MAILPMGFLRSSIFQFFPQAMSLVNGKAGPIFTIMVACQALEAIMTIMKYQVEQFNKFGVTVMALGIDEVAER